MKIVLIVLTIYIVAMVCSFFAFSILFDKDYDETYEELFFVILIGSIFWPLGWFLIGAGCIQDKWVEWKKQYDKEKKSK